MIALVACDRESPGSGNNANVGNSNSTNSNSCPVAQPEEAAACTEPDIYRCAYVVELCPCDVNDLYSYCDCFNGEWSCFREYDCYVRCGDAGGM
ncbi:MAG: hypothetical protein ABI333_00025 [bacterium]